jgi:FtsZ-binding cell division protein ZapB
MSDELDRIKVLEGKIGHVIDYVNKLAGDNEKLRQQVKELRLERKDTEELARRAGKLDEEIKRYENERESIKGRIEALIGQIDKLGI